MQIAKFWLLGAFSVCVAVGLAGCAKTQQEETTADATTAEADHEHMEGEHDHEHDQAAIDAELAKLSPEEQAIAEAQNKMCLVSNEPLGSMGPPVLVKDVGGHDFLICCAACEHELRKDPEKYAAMLKKKDEATTQPAAEATPATEPTPSTEEEKKS